MHKHKRLVSLDMSKQFNYALINQAFVYTFSRNYNFLLPFLISIVRQNNYNKIPMIFFNFEVSKA